MLASKMVELGKKRSVIREIFEYGNKRAAEIGRENVFDFSLGNPSIPAPPEVDKTIKELIDSMNSVQLHGYTSAPGAPDVRAAIAASLNERFGTDFTAGNLYMTMGAAASLSACLKALACEGDEFIAFTPYFPEYRVFTEAAGGKLVEVKSNDGDFQIDFAALEKALSSVTKAVIVNSPNNPSGVVLNENSINGLCDLLRRKSDEYGHPIFIISDEPYRELVYDADTVVPYIPNLYDNTLVCYSYSKSLSLPGERIGYIVVPNKVYNFEDVYAAVCGAGRALGYVCAGSLMQRVVAKCCNLTGDISAYKTNRDILMSGLESYGYDCVKPDGAFYLFVKSPEPDAWAFCDKAKKYELLLVPGDDFGCPGYVRISYCVSKEQIERSMPAFKKLAEEYGK